MNSDIRKLLEDVQSGAVSVDDALMKNITIRAMVRFCSKIIIKYRSL